MEQLEIRKAAIAAIVAHATAALPDECCGVLIGTAERIEQTARTRNMASTPRKRFLVNPEDHFAAIRHARAAGLSVVGAYHSHPRGRPVPSDTDRAEAFEDPAFVHLIVSPVPEKGLEMVAYRFRAGTFAQVELVTV